MEAGLKVCKLQPIINSTSAERARLETFLPLAKTFEAEIIGLCMTEKGVCRDANERVEAAMTIMGAMMEFDVPLDRLYLDPLLLPVGVAQQQALEAAEAIAMFRQLNDPPLKTVVGLSNIYNGCPEHVKSPMAAALLALLIPAGLDAGDHGPQRRAADGGRAHRPGRAADDRRAREVDVGAQERDAVLPLVPRLGSDTT